MKRLAALLFITVFALGCASTAGSGGRSSGQSDLEILKSEDLTIVKHGKKEWFAPLAFHRWNEEQKQKLRDMGAPSNVINQYDQTLPQARAMELLMVDETEHEKAAFCQLGFYFDKSTSIKFSGIESLTLTLQSPSTGESVEVPDQGLLFRKVDGQSAKFFDSSRGPVLFTWDFQKPKSKSPNVVFARFAHRYFGWRIISAHLDSNRVQVNTRPKR